MFLLFLWPLFWTIILLKERNVVMNIFLIMLIINFILFSLLFLFCALKVASNADDLIDEMNLKK